MRASRRHVIAGAGAAAACALVLSYEGWRHLGKHYPPTPYDDLLARLPNRDAAKRVGKAFLIFHSGFIPRYAASALRQRIGKAPLRDVLEQEIAAGQLTEAGHWLLPETLAGLCALTAKA